MGYIFAGILLLVILGLLIAALARSSDRTRRGQLPSDHPLEVARPAADEPSPASSVTATPRQKEEAARRTPPA